MTTDTVTTALGLIMAAATAAQTSFVSGLPANGNDWLKVAVAICFACIGYFTNKKDNIQVTTDPNPKENTHGN